MFEYLQQRIHLVLAMKELELVLIMFTCDSQFSINSVIPNTLTTFFTLIILFQNETKYSFIWSVLRIIPLILVLIVYPSPSLAVMVCVNQEQSVFLHKYLLDNSPAKKHLRYVIQFCVIIGAGFSQRAYCYDSIYQGIMVVLIAMLQFMMLVLKQQCKTTQDLKQQPSKTSYQGQPPLMDQQEDPFVSEDRAQLILKTHPWVQNQQVIVYDDELNIIYQNFLMGELIRHDADFENTDYSKIFLESWIRTGGREVCELLGQFEDISEGNKYVILGDQLLVNLVNRLMSAPGHQTYFLHFLENKYLDLSGWSIKVIKAQPRIVVFFFEKQYTKKEKTFIGSSVVLNMFQTFILQTANYLNCSLVVPILNMMDCDPVAQKQLNILRICGQRHNYFTANMRDHVLNIEKQLFLKITSYNVFDTIEESLAMYEDIAMMKNITFHPQIDIPDNLHTIMGDVDRLRQVLSCLLNIATNYSCDNIIKIDVKAFNMHGLIIQIKDTQLGKDEVIRQKISSQLKLSKKREVDLGDNLELSICHIIAYQLSGQLKKGIEFSFDRSGLASFTIYIESAFNENKMTSLIESTQIRMIGNKKYFETSLSMLIAFENSSSQNREDSRIYSVSQLSKQLSYKQPEPDIYSNFFSQISKIKQDSHHFTGSSNRKPINPIQGSGQRPDSIIQNGTILSRTLRTKPLGNFSNMKIESVGEGSFRISSQIDFGNDSNFEAIDPPQMVPKLLRSVIKYKVSSSCCSKVLLADSDYQSLLLLQMVMRKFRISYDLAYDGQQAYNLIEVKARNPCKCGNNTYLLYFLEIHTPVISGLDLVKRIKALQDDQILNRGFTIACSGYVDLNVKLECFRFGMDYHLAKPFNLIELGAVVQYLQ